MSSFEDFRVVYKLHPHGEAEKYDPLVKREFISEIKIRPDTNIYELIEAVGVVVGTQTSALPEALVSDTPAIQMFPDESTIAWRDYGLRSVSTPTEIEAKSAVSHRRQVRSGLAACGTRTGTTNVPRGQQIHEENCCAN